MNRIGFEEMQAMQQELRAKYREQWGELSPARGRELLLWAMAEGGEVADIIKKEGDAAIMTDPATRAHFAEEVCDVLMYLTDLLICYSITPQELSEAYVKKHRFNMQRSKT